MSKVNEAVFKFSIEDLGVDERGVIAFIEEQSNFKCSIDSFGNQIIVSASGFDAEYVIDVFDKAVAEIKKTDLKREATPLYTSVKFFC